MAIGRQYRIAFHGTMHIRSDNERNIQMKNLFTLLKDIACIFVKFIENHPTAASDGIETRALTKRFTLDNVAKTAFGVDGKAFESYEDISDFNKLVDQFLKPGTVQSIFIALTQIFPGIVNLASLSVVKPEVESKLIEIISDVLKHRRANNVEASDYLQFLIELSKAKHFGDTEITAHASTFFLDGYETSSLTLSFLLFNLAQNPEYQNKIREEIKKYELENKGQLTYDALHEMPWLNACLYESLRVTPVADVLTKRCNEPFEYTATTSDFKKMSVKLIPGDVVVLPYAMTTEDPNYFESPKKFTPERMFSKDSFIKGTFHPFSDGPRACIVKMFEVLLATFIVLLVLWYKIRSYYWVNRGVPGPKPWPIVGNLAEHLFGRKTIGQVITEIYQKYDEYPFVGIFRATSPCLLVRDPEFVNRILVKDHKSFYNNDFNIDKKKDPLFGQNPFVLRNQEWRDTRHMLTPGFTGGKMKDIYPLIVGVAAKLVKFVENNPSVEADGVNARELTRRFTLDNVAIAAFGIDGKSFESEEISEFMELANRILTPGSLNGILQQLTTVLPILRIALSVKMVPKDAEHRLIEIVTQVVNHRASSNLKINDYFEFILQIAKEKGLSNTDIAAHATTFFLDGYESSSNVMTSLLMNLAVNPTYQKKIRDEIKTVEENNNGITYETIFELKWLDACLNETLRFTPLFDIMVKTCTQPFQYTPDSSDFKKITVKLYPGDTVILPYSLLMNDEKYVVNPKEFLPERMLGKADSNRSIFFPFGNGPRTCIGQRFGIMQIKQGVAELIKHFDISLSPKFRYPPKLIPLNFLNEIQGGVWLRFKKIGN
ncbi:hypothetical protein D910_09634 [Dendroctonus ponderosae]|uniref:Cytochrome P450 n=2 Tax=Dendroctonus ponderosae TaxID=77166 RepID=U4UH14_DENPD|nr:hypothetical protein D910_09634 [Dendroctonus ponderosae]